MKKLAPVLAVMIAALAFAPNALAADGEAAGYIGLGAGLAIGIAALGGALGQGNAAKAMYESVARNPQAAGKLTAPFFVGMALIESLVIYALVVGMQLIGKIG